MGKKSRRIKNKSKENNKPHSQRGLIPGTIQVTGIGNTDFQEAHRHARVVFDGYPAPTGEWPDAGSQKYYVAASYSSLVKYLARHTSRTIPPGKHHREEGCPINESLRYHLRGLSRTARRDVPSLFFDMVDHLHNGSTLELPNELYEAAFARELCHSWEQFLNDADSI